ncbi:MAG TPA: metallophosphoesterase, partial [Myxococcaceae bacterium]|nr:metallophosphoesterase [Myxococcaceae bacterium]
ALLELSAGGLANAYRHAEQTLSAIAADVQRMGADHLILSGDVTAYAMEAEFAHARAALGALADDKRRCTVVPGNHDTYTPEAVSSRLFERYFGHLLESDCPEYCAEGPFPFVRLLGEDAAVVGLLSARVPPVPGLSYGVIGKRQLEGLARLLTDARLRERAVLVVVHHAPLTRSGRPDKPSHGLVDARKLFQLVHGPRFAVLHGHIHKRYYHPPTADRPHVFGAGSSTQEGREGYWLIQVERGRVLGGEQHVPVPRATAA